MKRDGGPRSSSPMGKPQKTVVLTPSNHRERYADRHLITLNGTLMVRRQTPDNTQRYSNGTQTDT